MHREGRCSGLSLGQDGAYVLIYVGLGEYIYTCRWYVAVEVGVAGGAGRARFGPYLHVTE